MNRTIRTALAAFALIVPALGGASAEETPKHVTVLTAPEPQTQLKPKIPDRRHRDNEGNPFGG